MIQFILMLFGLTFSNDNTNRTDNNQTIYTITTYSGSEQSTDDGGPVGGNSGQLPPPR
ncbi:hypothetical protein [Chryseobacterium sp. StRB126]|uniref:hypothetical protein n=1 Tax=Chryseobacterium sp. StRB126 TaxID=878220 RepID=UPI000AA6EA0E|nr:hypothetical protein [Chryseobacterium sp. StRB126]